MGDASRTAVIFITFGFIIYLAWKNELTLYGGFATSGSLPKSGSSTTTTTGQNNSSGNNSSSDTGSSTSNILGDAETLAPLLLAF